MRNQLSIGQHMLKVRASLIDHPAAPSLKPNKVIKGGRVFNAELAALIYALMPPDVKQGSRNTLRTRVAGKISFITGGSVEAVKKIWAAEAHRDASLNAMKLSKQAVITFAGRCQIDEPYLQTVLAGLK